jgi:hypothetical protein
MNHRPLVIYRPLIEDGYSAPLINSAQSFLEDRLDGFKPRKDLHATLLAHRWLCDLDDTERVQIVKNLPSSIHEEQVVAVSGLTRFMTTTHKRERTYYALALQNDCNLEAEYSALRESAIRVRPNITMRMLLSSHVTLGRVETHEDTLSLEGINAWLPDFIILDKIRVIGAPQE